MPAVGTSPIYELIVEQRMGLQSIKNVFYYNASTPPVTNEGSNRLIDAFTLVVLPVWETEVSVNLTFEAFKARRLNNLLDFAETTGTNTGDLTGTRAANFVAAKLKYIRTTKETRNGWKRIAGLTQTQAQNNSLTTQGQTDMDALAVAFSSNIANGGLVFDPIIVGGKRPGGVPAAESAWIWQDIDDVQAQSDLTSQTSRKLGVGE